MFLQEWEEITPILLQDRGEADAEESTQLVVRHDGFCS